MMQFPDVAPQQLSPGLAEQLLIRSGLSASCLASFQSISHTTDSRIFLKYQSNLLEQTELICFIHSDIWRAYIIA